MAAFGTKVVVLMMVLPSLLLLQQISSVEAVDILLYNENNCDGAVAIGCYSVEAGTCCLMDNAGAVEIVNLLDGQSASVYSGGSCTTEISSVNGPYASWCYSGTSFSGANWFNSTA
jgi:hypothetical protein